MADIFSEVDEDVRKDKSLALWKKYGNYVIGAAVLIVVGTASYVGWQNYTLSQSESQGAAFQAASALVAENKLDAGAASFGTLAEDGNAGYRALARLREAGLLVETGKGSEALAIYDQLAADSSVDKEFSSLANLLAGYYLLDNGTSQEVRMKVASVAEAGSIWSASANELIALSYLQEGESVKAVELLTQLKNDAAVPSDIKARVEQLLAALGGE
ncbi:tetratricopeptide repeat protein [Sneathiella marina]|uniref:Tetratricopeptide repeat protein n=1 Tax=Sneathiella marina TaxID=2950108 RepID=A0ABY4W2R0_9PROT|nr:tetratricopeptide repeat protein [Sneathiella marina]USG60010.1 tetratricopeptide repeat protein [Sneathiella marina]